MISFNEPWVCIANCSNPDGVDYIVPGNDDAIRAINLYTSAVARFIDVYSRIEKRADAQIDAIDLRYDTGLAVSYKH